MAVSRTWNFTFTQSIDEVWRVLSDTDSFNRAAGLDFRFEREGEVMRGSTRVAGISVRWVETPIDWIAPHSFCSKRVYDSGPIAQAIARANLTADEEGVHVKYTVALSHRGMPRFAVSALASMTVWPGLDTALKRVAAVIRGEALTVFEGASFDADTIAHVAAGAEVDSPLAEALLRGMCGRPLEGGLLRPIAVARATGRPETEVTLACLRAAKSGVLHLRVALLCPRCRGVEMRTQLAALSDAGHCTTCNLSFETDLASSAEVLFEPDSSLGLRTFEPACIFSPARTPHVLAQTEIAPGGRLRFGARFDVGGYRLDTGEHRLLLVCDHSVTEDGITVATLEDHGFSPAVLRVHPSTEAFVVRNRTGSSQRLELHVRWMRPDALTIGAILAEPAYAPLLPEEFALGAEVRVRSGAAIRVVGTRRAVSDAQTAVGFPYDEQTTKRTGVYVFSDVSEAARVLERIAGSHAEVGVGVANGTLVEVKTPTGTRHSGTAVGRSDEAARTVVPIMAAWAGNCDDEGLAPFRSRIRKFERDALPPLLAFSAWMDQIRPTRPPQRTAPAELPPCPEGFREVRELGRGGMGRVLEVVDDAGSTWALKQILVGRDSDLEQMFHKEAYYASTIIHENLVHIEDWGWTSSGPFLLMERLKGVPLSAQLRKSGRWPEGATDLAIGSLRGLAALHGLQLVHRDIKPANLFLTATLGPGRVKILDFGLTRRSGMKRGERLVGTPDYMSPEQLMRIDQDARSDLYALGVVLFRALSGRRPWRGQTVGQRSVRRVEDDIDAIDWSGIPEPWTPVLQRALRRDPNDRFQSADAFLQAVTAIA